MKNHTSPTKPQFISQFHLTKTTTKAHFADGKLAAIRTLYIDNHGKYFVFYNNDLHTFYPYTHNSNTTENTEKIDGRLGAGYSWYH